jgi:hypothetical protein
MNINRVLIIVCSSFIVVALAAAGCFAESISSAPPYKKINSEQSKDISAVKTKAKPFTLVLFWTDGCSSCAAAKKFIAEMASRFPSMTVKDYEVWDDPKNRTFMGQIAKAYHLKLEGVPVTFIGKKGFSGFSASIQQSLLSEIERCSIDGCADPRNRSTTYDKNDAEIQFSPASSGKGVCSAGIDDNECK